MTSISIDPDALGNHGVRFDEHALATRQLVEDFLAGLSGIGAAWGNDHFGGEFAKVYRPALDQLVEGLHGVAGGVHSVGANLRVMAHSYHVADLSARH